jgi:DNA-binding NtrC family response regulator
LIANEREDHLVLMETVVAAMGHDVVARETDVGAVGALTARVRPDLALVGLGLSSEHGLDLVTEIVRESFCPVIAVLSKKDSVWVTDAAQRGLFAYVIGDDQDELQSAIDITLRRFAEQQTLRGAFERRDAEDALEREATRLRQRQALDVHESVVQNLAIAKLASELGRADDSSAALRDGLEAARNIVARSLEELREQGVPTSQLIRDAAAVPDG